MTVEGPFAFFILLTRLRLRDVVKEGSEAYIERPLLIGGVLHRTHKVLKDVVTVGLILFDANPSDKVRGDEFKNAQFLCKDKSTHRLARIQYTHQLILNPFT